MTDENGNVFYWTFFRLEKVWSGKRTISGWAFKDHEGYERFQEGNWHNFVPYFRMVAENYGLTTQLS